MMYMSVRNFIDSLNIAPGHSMRMDCPECFGKNSFSVSNLNGQMLWYCFRASCSIKGKADYDYKIADFTVNSERSNLLGRCLLLERLSYCKESSQCKSYLDG